MKTLKKITVIASVLILAIGCKEVKTPGTSKAITLKDVYKENFYIGVAINENQILEKDSLESTLINHEFNSITAEDIMKSIFIHPAKDTFDFKLTDTYVALGLKDSMYIHGHTLIWHSQLAPWMSQISDSLEMAQAMDNHIKQIVNRYKGKINSWDVVNEALNEDGTLRKSVFLNTIGEDYIIQAFKSASEADPKADLYYNDYNLFETEKRKGAIALVKHLQNNGAKIDGVGIQGHLKLNSPSIEELEKSIIDFSDLGVKVAITELDIKVLPTPWDLVGADVNQKFTGSDKMNPYPKNLPDSIQVKLAKRYSDLFKLFIKHEDKISRVTFWGLSDADSWLNNWPIPGRTSYPLLFDRELKPKKAYDSIIALKTNNKTN